jgi:hypothetical protein
LALIRVIPSRDLREQQHGKGGKGEDGLIAKRIVRNRLRSAEIELDRRPGFDVPGGWLRSLLHPLGQTIIPARTSSLGLQLKPRDAGR